MEIGAFFEHFQWPRNAFANHLFTFMESADEDGRVDFGDFVKVRYDVPHTQGRRLSSCGLRHIVLLRYCLERNLHSAGCF